MNMSQVLIAPIVTEKMYSANAKENSVGFWVHTKATKQTIKSSVERFFNVKVKDIQVARYKPKKVKFGNKTGYQNARKKAYIQLHEGHSINFSEE